MATTEVNNDEYRTSKIRGLLSVDIRMLPSKIAYLLFGGLLGSHMPFLNVFFLSVGLSETQAGLISGIRFAPSSIAGPMWGMLADYYGRRKLILILLCLGAAFPLFSMPWVSRAIYPDPYINEANSTHINRSMPSMSDAMSVMIPNDHPFGTKAKMATNTLFYSLLSIMMFASIFVGPLPGYVDSIVMNIVKTGDNESNYGAQRIFGSLGFSIASFFAGIAADNYKDPHMSKYTVVFCLYLPYTLLLIPIGYYLVGQTRWDSATSAKENTKDEIEASNAEKRSMKNQILFMFCKIDVIVVMITALVSGLAGNMFLSFALLLVSDVMKASETEMSLIFVIATLAEVILFPFTSKLIRLLGGTSVAITLGILSYFIRFLLMSYTTQLWIMLFVQILHGVGFALSWAAMMEYIHEVTPQEIMLTMFLIFQSIQFGIAALLANVVGGYLYQSYGGRALFRGNAILCGVWTVIMVIYYGSKHIKCKYFPRNEAPVECKFTREKCHRSKDMEEVNDIGVDNTATRIAEEEVYVHYS